MSDYVERKLAEIRNTAGGRQTADVIREVIEDCAREAEEVGRAMVVDDNPRRACWTAAARIRGLLEKR